MIAQVAFVTYKVSSDISYLGKLYNYLSCKFYIIGFFFYYLTLLTKSLLSVRKFEGNCNEKKNYTR